MQILKVTDSCLHFPTMRFSIVNNTRSTIKKYSLLVKLNQHIKQLLQMDRNSKEINFS